MGAKKVDDGGDVMQRLQQLEKFRDETREWQESMVHWREAFDKQTVAMRDMVDLFRRIESSLWLFVRIGNALKWVAGVIAAISAIAYVVAHRNDIH